ncbi:alpha/beta hydrolase fold domain-containing protein [uncultured Tateyamaria sp.]|uniref:alpha/beta hydrolase n=1 Tax=uncultured Tateyamaria sp. TaxID=455651 RepID=UPI0026351185|nr:alpha/beta hydrolase fold domain-containing protein [uncultured Tateyamaria sp.]
MNSIDYNALRHVANGQRLRTAIAERLHVAPVTGPPVQMRARFAQLVGAGPAGHPATIAGVPCVRHGDGPAVMWLHGGGYVFGGPHTHARAADALAHVSGCAVYVPDYRLAPEHPWPAPLEDACAVLDALPGPVALVGDSAGGHLALAVARRRAGRVHALALISPNTDRTGRSWTRAANSDSDLMNSDADDARLARMAMPDLAPDDPDASPILADLSALPRTLVTASPDEVLFGDSVLLMQALAHAGHNVSADMPGGLWHLWPLWPGRLRAADMTLRRIAAFLTADADAIGRDPGS